MTRPQDRHYYVIEACVCQRIHQLPHTVKQIRYPRSETLARALRGRRDKGDWRRAAQRPEQEDATACAEALRILLGRLLLKSPGPKLLLTLGLRKGDERIHLALECPVGIGAKGTSRISGALIVEVLVAR